MLALETKERVARKDMGSVTYLTAYLKKIQEHLVLIVLILRLNILLNER